MAWRIQEQVVSGELDNRSPGRVTGILWLAGRAEPIRLELEGDPLRDMAGCLLTFTNPRPVAGGPPGFAGVQRGAVGDMTASRKVRVPDVPEEELLRLCRADQPYPSHLANSLYLEWFSEANGRVVIEAVDYQVTLSEPGWRMTREQEQAQALRNHATMDAFLERLNSPREPAGEADPADDQPMDEFRWERYLKESDACTDRYGALLEKYKGHPQQEQLVARAMGWDWLDERLDAARRPGPRPPAPEPEAIEELPELVPDPATEGVDWVRDRHGDPQHPLVIRTSEVAIGMYHRCKALGLMGEDGDPDLHDMIFQAEMTGAKLAGALNSLCYDGDDGDPGFVVACLKRSLKYLNQALGAAAKVEAKACLPEAEVVAYRNALLAIREGILALMQRFRARLR